MCHLLLALPFVALPLLWLVPWQVGVPLYGLVLVLSAAIYLMTFAAMRRPITAGAETLIHAVGTVRSVDRRTAHVWVASESWSASSADGVLAVGDAVEVIGRDGLTLKVRLLAGRHSPAWGRAPAPAGVSDDDQRGPARVHRADGDGLSS